MRLPLVTAVTLCAVAGCAQRQVPPAPVSAQTDTITITLRQNPLYTGPDSGVAACVASVDPETAYVRRGGRVTWNLQDPMRECDTDLVALRGKRAGLGRPHPIRSGTQMHPPGGPVSGIPNGEGRTRRYEVMYAGEVAVDPELVID